MKKYLLISWPESQQFIGCREAYFIDSARLDSSTYAVLEKLYILGKKNPDLHGLDLDKAFYDLKEDRDE